MKKDLYLFGYYDDIKDEMCVCMKNTETGKKSVYIQKQPKIPIYVVKKPKEYYQEFVNIQDVDVAEVRYKYKAWDIAGFNGIPRDEFTRRIKNKEMRVNDIILNKTTFGTDIDIRDWYIMKYMDSFDCQVNDLGYKEYDDTPPINNIHIGMYDIETDELMSKNPAKIPIYMHTYVDNKSNTCYTYYLKDNKYKNCDLIDSQRPKILKDMDDILRKDIEDLHIKDETKKKLLQDMMYERVNKMEYIIIGYDSEKDLIKDMIQLIFREIKPDFLLIFNAEFDIGRVMARGVELGLKMEDLFCIPEYGKYINFDFEDQKFNPKEKRHNYDCASETKIIDSRILYYSIRAHMGFASTSLDATVDREIGIKKLGYGHICDHILKLPYTDYVTTLMYNIRDVLVMLFLEDAIKDIDFLLSVRFLSRTEYDRVFVPSVSVSNAFYHLSLRNNKIMQPNFNKILNRYTYYTKEKLEAIKEVDPITHQLIMDLKNTASIEGGLCTDPTKFDGYGKKPMLNFMDSSILKWVIDMDAKSMYPSNLISSVMSKTQLIGKISKINDKKVTYAYEPTTALMNQDIIRTAELLFNIPPLENTLVKLNKLAPKEEKQTARNKHFETMLTEMENPTIFNLLNKTLKQLINIKYTTKDLELEHIKRIAAKYIISNQIENTVVVEGARLTYKIVSEGNEISPYDFIGYNTSYTNAHTKLYIDSRNKMTDHDIVDILEYREDNSLDLKNKIISDMSLKDYAEYLDVKNNSNIEFKLNDIRFDLSPRALPFNKDLMIGHISDTYVSFTNLPKKPIIRGADISFELMDSDFKLIDIEGDGQSIMSDFSVYAGDSNTYFKYEDFKCSEYIKFIYLDNKGRKKSKKIDIIDVKADVYETNLLDEDTPLYMVRMKYNYKFMPMAHIEVNKDFIIINY